MLRFGKIWHHHGLNPDWITTEQAVFRRDWHTDMDKMRALKPSAPFSNAISFWRFHFFLSKVSSRLCNHLLAVAVSLGRMKKSAICPTYPPGSRSPSQGPDHTDLYSWFSAVGLSNPSTVWYPSCSVGLTCRLLSSAADLCPSVVGMV